jgi:hypothetical protein
LMSVATFSACLATVTMQCRNLRTGSHIFCKMLQTHRENRNAAIQKNILSTRIFCFYTSFCMYSWQEALL